MTQDPQAILPAVTEAALAAGRMIAAEFSLPAGPRLIDHVTAPIDHEVELYLRDRLMALVTARFVGEEAGIVTAEANGLCWVVDPHDGTRAYLEGKGIPSGIISTQAFGESAPRVDTADGVRELQNRRVEITYGPGSGQ